jgi:hypothetical protein
MIEGTMMVRVNKTLRTYNTNEIKSLGNKKFSNLPGGFIDGGQEEGDVE